MDVALLALAWLAPSLLRSLAFGLVWRAAGVMVRGATGCLPSVLVG